MECPPVQTGIPLIDAIVAVIGIVYVVASAVGNALPEGSKAGEVLRRLSLDLSKFRSGKQPDA